MTDEVKNTCVVKVKVFAVWMIEDYKGEAILAAVRPRFVVAVLLDGFRRKHTVENSDVAFTVNTLAVFAIESVVRVFKESEVVGKVYDLRIEVEQIQGKPRYFLRVV
ncbi:MAG: hypothetical protein ACLQU5_29065 [Isosphaeraceae bacterium]